MASSSKSNWINNKLKQFDFLGEGINFTMNNEPQFKTVCGGILRLVLYIITTLLFFFFGKDFILKQNPRIYYEIKQTLEPLEITYTANDFFFAIRFENYMNKNVDIRDYFHLEANYDQASFNSNSSFSYSTKSFPLISCSEIKFNSEVEHVFKSMPNSIKSEYYCPLIPKDTEITITGNIMENDQDIKQFSMRLKLCIDSENEKNISNVTNNKRVCKNYKKFFNEYLKNQDLYIRIIINDIKFDKDNYTNPLKKKAGAFYNLFSKNIVKRDTLYISKTDLIQDDGSIFVFEDTYSEYGFSKFTTDFLYFENVNSDSEITNIINNYYQLQISADNRYNFYSRKYMKFQDVLALLGSFMNLMILITKSVYAFYHRFRLRTFFFNRFVRFGLSTNLREKEKTDNNKINFNHKTKLENKIIGLLDSSTSRNKEINLDNTLRINENSVIVSNDNFDSGFLHKQSIDKNKKENKLVSSSYSGVSQKAENNNEIDKKKNNDDTLNNLNHSDLSKNEINKDNTCSTIIKDYELEAKLKLEKNLDFIYDSISKEKNKVVFSFWENLKKIFFRKKKVFNNDFYLKSEYYYQLFLNKFDVFYYLKKMKNLSLIKKCLLDENQLNLLNFISNKYFTLRNEINNELDYFNYSKKTFNENVVYLTDNRDKTIINKIILEELFKDKEK